MPGAPTATGGILGLTVAGVKKVAQDGTESVHVHEERVVPSDAVERHVAHIIDDFRQALREFFLLMWWIKNVGSDADDDRPFQSEALEA